MKRQRAISLTIFARLSLAHIETELVVCKDLCPHVSGCERRWSTSRQLYLQQSLFGVFYYCSKYLLVMGHQLFDHLSAEQSCFVLDCSPQPTLRFHQRQRQIKV